MDNIVISMRGKQLTDTPEFLTVEEAAALLRIGRTSAYALAREWRDTGGQRGLPVIELGRQLRVPRSALEEMHSAPIPSDPDEERPRGAVAKGADRDPRPRRRRWGS